MRLKTQHFNYFREWILNKDIVSIISGIELFLFWKNSYSRDRLLQSRVLADRKFLWFCRGGTTDFVTLTRPYEIKGKEFLNRFIKTCDVCLDIGANIGLYSIIFASFGKKVFAFEPVPHNLRSLKTNILLNNFENLVTIIPYAVGKDVKKIHFTYNPLNTGASCRDINGTLEINTTSIDMVTEFSELNEFDKIIVKIDAEEMEQDVFEGGEEFFSKHKNMLIYCEYSANRREKMEKTLHQLGFEKIIVISASNLVALKGSFLNSFNGYQ